MKNAPPRDRHSRFTPHTDDTAQLVPTKTLLRSWTPHPIWGLVATFPPPTMGAATSFQAEGLPKLAAPHTHPALQSGRFQNPSL